MRSGVAKEVNHRHVIKVFAFAIGGGLVFGALRALVLPDLAFGWALLLAVAVGASIGGILALRERRRRAWRSTSSRSDASLAMLR